MSKVDRIIIGTRGSDLALWQANFVKDSLAKLNQPSEIKIIKTRGDQIQNLSFEKMEGKGFFTKEIEDSLLADEIHIAIHSLQDLETSEVPGLSICAVSYREDPSDTLLINKKAVDQDLLFSFKKNAKIGTSSARRRAQLLSFREDTDLVDLRGNVPTRIQKLREGAYDAIMLATAGLNRLEINLDEFHVERLDPKVFIPAPAQGVLGLQIKSTNKSVHDIIYQLNDAAVEEIVAIEREVLRSYSGGCQLPLGVYCEKENDTYTAYGFLGMEKGNSSRASISSTNQSSLPSSILESLKKKS
jgi:hydroxymethylbilane synthase